MNNIILIFFILLVYFLFNKLNKANENFSNKIFLLSIIVLSLVNQTTRKLTIETLKIQTSNPILYVTSFNKKIYETSGIKLINSFIKYIDNADMLVCYENIDLERRHNIKGIIKHNLNNDKYLNDWLNENIDIIPVDLGGESKMKLDIWNYRASLWFRKVASLNYAKRNYGGKYNEIIWIDADCVFIKKLLYNVIKEHLLDYDSLYMYGKKRINNAQTSVETGLIIFNSKNNYQAITKLCDEYKNKNFRKYKRWDDGYVYEMMLKNNKDNNSFKNKDLVINAKNVSNPLSDTVFGKYIEHNKGKHEKLFFRTI
tara:strand:+ start:9292 stop:10230 length:939 start_codon:yes stop_codon:yes gene_type:complete